ncbi:MAG: hypothetical protein ACXQTS_01575 [Candidatus Methanospirareceae archaeon]
MKVNHFRVLSSFLVIALLLTSMQTSASFEMEKSKFVEAKLEDIKYDSIGGLVKNGSIVSLSVVLSNFSKEVGSSQIILNSSLEKPTPGIAVNGESKEININEPFPIEHKEVREVRITLSGKAPEVDKRKNITILNITQTTTEGTYLVLEVKREVTSELIEKAITEMNRAMKKIEMANWTIANATRLGADVSDARISLESAELYLEKGWEAYREERPEEALEAAENASYFAMVAKEKANTAIKSVKFRNYGVISAVIGIIVIVLLFLYKKRRREWSKL